MEFDSNASRVAGRPVELLPGGGVADVVVPTPSQGCMAATMVNFKIRHVLTSVVVATMGIFVLYQPAFYSTLLPGGRAARQSSLWKALQDLTGGVRVEFWDPQSVLEYTLDEFRDSLLQVRRVELSGWKSCLGSCQEDEGCYAAWSNAKSSWGEGFSDSKCDVQECHCYAIFAETNPCVQRDTSATRDIIIELLGSSKLSPYGPPVNSARECRSRCLQSATCTTFMYYLPRRQCHFISTSDPMTEKNEKLQSHSGWYTGNLLACSGV